jgi:iron complex outermembrane receptor protein
VKFAILLASLGVVSLAISAPVRAEQNPEVKIEAATPLAQTTVEDCIPTEEDCMPIEKEEVPPEEDCIPIEDNGVSTEEESIPTENDCIPPGEDGVLHILSTGETEGILSPEQLRFDSPNQQIILDSEEIERFQFPMIGDVLRQQPSVLFGGPFDENRDIRLRGLPSGFTQVLIDGQRLPSNRNDRQVPVNIIPTNLIESVEIIRTPTAAQDAQGIAGTVNLVLRSPQERIRRVVVGGSTLAGSRPDGNLELLYGDIYDNVSFLINGAIASRASIKFKDRRDFDATGVEIQSDIEDDIKDFFDYSFAPRLEWKVTPQDTLFFDGLILGTEEYRDVERNITQLTFRDNSSLQRQREQQRFNDENSRVINWRASTLWKRELSTDSNLEIGLLVQGLDSKINKDEREIRTDTNFNNAGIGRVGTPQISTTKQSDSTTETDWIATTRLNWQVSEAHLVSLGVNGYFRDRNADRLQNNAPVPNSIFGIDETQINVFIQDEWEIAPNHTLLAGVRLEQVYTTAIASDENSGSQSDTQINPSLSYRFQASPSTVLRAGVARTVTRPSFGDLVPFVNERRGDLTQPDQVGNPDLQPQSAWGINIGIEQEIGNGSGLVGLNGFLSTIDNLVESQIIQDPISGRFLQLPINIGSARTYGLELDARTELDFIGLPGLTMVGNFSWLGSAVDDIITGETRPFNEQPNYLFNIGFDYTLPSNALSFGLNYRYVPQIFFTEQTGDILQERFIEAEGTLDAYLTWRPIETLAFSLYARNLLGIESVRPRRGLENGVLQSSQTDFQRADRIVGINMTWDF